MKRFLLAFVLTFLNTSLLLAKPQGDEEFVDASDISTGLRTSTISEYLSMQRMELPADVRSISSMLQDPGGLVWLGTNSGLYAYDGYRFYDHRPSEKSSGVNSLFLDNDQLFIGSDNGVLAYNIRFESYQTPNVKFPKDVEAVTMLGERLWIGTPKGLFSYEGNKVKKHRDFAVNAFAQIASDSLLWVGSDDGLWSYDMRREEYRSVSIPSRRVGRPVRVRALLCDTLKQRLWIGTEGDLYCYEWASNRMVSLSAYRGVVVTSIAFDQRGHMLIGSEEGLYVERAGMPDTFADDVYATEPQHIYHDVQDSKSLPYDLIRSVMVDINGDLWVGTDNGMALHVVDETTPFIPIWKFTGVSRGNSFKTFFCDSKGTLWLGGNNGLIMTHPSLDKPEASEWYTSTVSEYVSGRNNIYQVVEDREHDIWMVTATGIYLRDENAWRHYALIDSAAKYRGLRYNAILVDNDNRVWAAADNGPVLVTTKAGLLKSVNTGSYVVDVACIDTLRGLTAMAVSNLAEVGNEVWALIGDSVIQAISKSDFSVRNITLPRGKDEHPTRMGTDLVGRIWIGVKGGLLCWDVDGFVIDSVAPPHRYVYHNFGSAQTLDFTSVGNALWITTTDGVWVAEVGDTICRRIREMGHQYVPICYNAAYDRLYLGGEDGLTKASPEDLFEKLSARPIELVALEVNGQMTYLNGWQGVRNVEYMGFGYQQNHLVFHFSDYPYNRLVKDRFVYRLRNLEKEWLPLPAGVNSIEYKNLKPANYWIEISRVGSNGELLNPFSLPFKIYPPWYLSWWAFVIYAFILAAGLVVLVYLWYTHNRLKIERREKKRSMEQTRDKMKLYADMSREFMEPINGIVTPLGDILKTQRNCNSEAKQMVEQANGNALLLSKMVHRLLDFDRIENDVNSPLMLSHQDLLALLKECYEEYHQGAFERNGLTSSFTSNVTECQQLIDKIKMVAVFTNILSNAARYTPRGGHVNVDFLLSGRYIIVTISDNGVGIPQKDLPYITSERYYQVSNNRRKVHSSGQGLYLARLFVEMHGGTFDIQSKEGKGTKVTMSWVHDADLGLATVEEARADDQTVTKLLRLDDVDFIERLTSIITRNMDDSSFDDNRLCKIIGLGKDAVNKQVDKELHTTLSGFILSIRLQKAARLLEAHYSLLEVMYLVGIRDQDTFVREFVNLYRMSPQEYAEKH